MADRELDQKALESAAKAVSSVFGCENEDLYRLQMDKAAKAAIRAYLAASPSVGRDTARPPSIDTTVSAETKAALDAVDGNIRAAAVQSSSIFVGAGPADQAGLVALAKRADEIAANPPSNDAWHIDWQSGYQDGAMAVAAEIDEFIAALSRAPDAEFVRENPKRDARYIQGWNDGVAHARAAPPAPQPALALIALEKWKAYDTLLRSLPGEGPLYGGQLQEVDAAYDACFAATESALASAKRFKEGE